MDFLTLKAAGKKSVAEAKTYTDQKDAENLQSAKDYADQLAFTGETAGIYMDRSLSYNLLLLAFRQHVWDAEDKLLITEVGTKTLTNTMDFPFNDSQVSVALSKTQKDTDYVVLAEITSASGNPGEIRVSDKQINGFKLAFTGSASTVSVRYIVIGGIIR